jgi:hypothetical protein
LVDSTYIGSESKSKNSSEENSYEWLSERMGAFDAS